jgi:hypothetical protein
VPNSPLDGSFESSKKRLKPKWVVAIIALIGTAVGGGVFAISIVINTGGDVEFGQGVAGIMACDTAVTLTPSASYDGATETFALSQILLTDVDDNNNCDGKTITVGVYASGESTPMEEWVTTGASAQATHTFNSVSSPSASAVYNITIESN